MNYIEMIKKYNPICKQEVKDKEIFLKYINEFGNILTRENEYAHFCSSALVVNKNMDKVVMVYHNIYKSWCWVGGHADGEENLIEQAKREINEETGLTKFKPLSEDFISIDTLPVPGHFKRGKYVPAHTHLNVAFLFVADDSEPLRIKEDENSKVEWIDIDKVTKITNEMQMIPVYNKIFKRMQIYKTTAKNTSF